MNTTTIGRSFTARAATAALALSALGLINASPVQAHDALVSTSPAEGETITTDPGEVSLTLTGAPQTSQGLQTTIIEVTAGDGHPSSSGDVAVNGPVISTPIELEHADSYTVAWRTVSADGHPIEGSYVFTYAPNGEGQTQVPTDSAAGPSATAEANSTGMDGDAGTPETELPAESDSSRQVDAASVGQSSDVTTSTVIGLGALAVVTAAIIAFLLGRRSRSGHRS